MDPHYYLSREHATQLFESARYLGSAHCKTLHLRHSDGGSMVCTLQNAPERGVFALRDSHREVV